MPRSPHQHLSTWQERYYGGRKRYGAFKRFGGKKDTRYGGRERSFGGKKILVHVACDAAVAMHSPSGCCVLVLALGVRASLNSIIFSLSLTDPQPVPFIQSSSLLFHSIQLLVRERGGVGAVNTIFCTWCAHRHSTNLLLLLLRCEQQ